MDQLTSIDWFKIWIQCVLLLALLLSLRLLIIKKTIKVHQFVINLLAFIVILFFVNEPILEYSDKDNYRLGFENVYNLNSSGDSIDLGFYYLSRFVAYFTNSYYFFFFCIAFIYLLGYIKFIKKYINYEYRFIIFLTTISALGFYNYGTNTLRQGMALSLFLLVFVYKENTRKSIIFSIISFLVHKSLIIPIAMYWLLKRFNLQNKVLYFWLICLVATMLFGGSLGIYLGQFLVSQDSRIDSYINGENENYVSGFKINFLIYSVVPIIFGLKIKDKINNAFYNEILSLYIAVNAIWLLVIRIAFTDRFAYLSWFLIPFILLYPFSIKKLHRNQNAIIALILMYLVLVHYLIANK